ncbi:hypothetical protein As57867_019150, partial [Aphanomyces stellatus]
MTTNIVTTPLVSIPSEWAWDLKPTTTNKQNSFVVPGLLIGIVGLVCACGIYCWSKWRQQHQPLLPHRHLEHLSGLKRDALEDPCVSFTNTSGMKRVCRSLGGKKWTCNICLFENAKARRACVLCETPPEISILNDLAFAGMGGLVSLDQLNDRQRSARLRSQWTRQHSNNNLHWVLSTPFDRPEHCYIIGCEDLGHPVEIRPWRAENANQCVLGERLPTWWAEQLQQLQAPTFSIKYAHLLKQIAHSYTNYTKMKVSRDQLFTESTMLLTTIPHDKLCAMTKITLLGESGIDAGGVTREWYTLFSTAILGPERGLFIINKTDQSLFINPNSATHHGPNHLQVYHAIGRLLGKAIVDGQVLPFQFSVPLFKALLGYPVSIEDIRYLDPVVYSSLVFVRDCTSDVAELALTFSATLDASTEVDLVPNGRAIEVTCANKAEYIERMVQYLLFDRVAPQLEKMVQGLYDVLPQELLMPFDYK